MARIDLQTCRQKLNIAIGALIFALSSHDDRTRRTARQALVSVGEPALDAVMLALRSGEQRTRWEAARVLREMQNPEAAPSLVDALRDSDFDVRWVASEGLIAMRWGGLRPLFQALVDHPDSVLLREAAHHVLRTLSKDSRLHNLVAPVADKLEDWSSVEEISASAYAALRALDSEEESGIAA